MIATSSACRQALPPIVTVADVSTAWRIRLNGWYQDPFGPAGSKP
jgi:hypothetical protein